MSPMELLGEKVGINREDIKSMNSIEWADTFYIYDYFKNNIDENITDKKNGIKIDLTIYHPAIASTSHEESELDSKSIKSLNNRFSKRKKPKEYYIEIDTIGSRYQLMEMLIEQEKYKSLII
jgi:hypothetical protein